MRNTIIFSILVVFINTSCIVSKKKYDDLLAQKIRLEADLSDKKAELDSLNQKMIKLSNELSGLRRDTMDMSQTLRTTSSKLNNLEKEYDQLNTFYKNLMNSTGKMNRDFADQKEQLLMIQSSLEKSRKLSDSLNESLIERERKVAELEAVLAKKDKAVSDLKNRITNALLNFKESDLTVKVKNGKVYVSLAEQLLFGSGSIQVDQKGVAALQQLAKAIKDQHDINIIIEGHTDNVPISKKSPYMQDNWDLSVMRATAITKILTQAGVAPSQITAAGRGEFVPLSGNDTAVSRQKNRRTEIIITPDLDELFSILESN